MFRGSSYHTLDAKGRIIIPARFRDVIRADGADGLMISRMDSCLVGFPFNDWRKIETKILAMAEKNDNMRRFRRVFFCQQYNNIFCLISSPSVGDAASGGSFFWEKLLAFEK